MTSTARHVASASRLFAPQHNTTFDVVENPRTGLEAIDYKHMIYNWHNDRNEGQSYGWRWLASLDNTELQTYLGILLISSQIDVSVCDPGGKLLVALY